MDLGRYLNVVRRGWKLVAALCLACVILAGAYSLLATPQFKATTTVFFYLTGGDSVTQLLQGSTYAQNQVRSYALLAATPAVLDPVIKDLGLDTNATALAQTVTAEVPLDTVVLDISVTNGSPDQAAAIANGIGNQLSKVVTAFSPAGTGASTAVSVRAAIVAPAPVPKFAFTPNTKLNGLMGLLGGLALGVAVVVVRDVLNNKVSSEDIVKGITPTPVIGSVPFDPETRRAPVIDQNQHGQRAEAFRRLSANFEFLNYEKSIRCLEVTSSLPDEGKSTLALNLAIAMSVHRRVVLVDADLRRPTVAELTGLEGSVGLSTVLTGKVHVDRALQSWRRGQLTVLTAGEIPPNPSELLGSEPMERLLKALSEQFDLIILDTAPLLPVSDAAILSKLTNGALVVVNVRKTKRQELQSALAAIAMSGGHTLGIVLNQTDSSEAGSYYGEYAVRESVVKKAK